MNEREKFEAWASDEGKFPNLLEKVDDYYRFTSTQYYWAGWQARAALAAQPAASAEPSDMAHEIWAAAQLAPGEGIVDGAARVEALLSRYGRPAGDAQPIRLEHMAVADEDGLRWMSGRKMPAGVESVELYAVPGYGKAPKFVYTAPVAAGDAQHYEAALRQIGDYAHDHSTGPAVPDALWAIRSLAYDALSDAPVATRKADDAALRAIAGYSNPGEGAMTAANMREIARKALSALPSPPPPPPSIPYRKVESGVVKPSRGAPVAAQKRPTWDELQALAVKHGAWVPGYGPFAAELLATYGAAPTEQPHWVLEWLNAMNALAAQKTDDALRAIKKIFDKPVTFVGDGPNSTVVVPFESHTQAWNHWHEAREIIDAAIAQQGKGEGEQ